MEKEEINKTSDQNKPKNKKIPRENKNKNKPIKFCTLTKSKIRILRMKVSMASIVQYLWANSRSCSLFTHLSVIKNKSKFTHPLCAQQQRKENIFVLF